MNGRGPHGVISEEEEKKCLNSELWHACAGPLVCLPTAAIRVVYFPQGHSDPIFGYLISRCTHQLRSLLLVTFTMFNGSSGTSTEVSMAFLASLDVDLAKISIGWCS
ncbi:hypothetical protein BHM03_00057102 [Ensete ventricosum]|nr:hypothetical protein BHM03_00057102 [Ensete ventricosum]